MADFFFDASALVKRYVAEVGSAWVSSLARPSAGNPIFVAAISAVEVASAIARRTKAGNLAPADAALARTQFDLDFDQQYLVVEITELVLRRAMDLADRHALRAYDAIQLSAVLTLNERRVAHALSPATLVSADQDLNAAARAEGLHVDDPNSHP